MINCPKCGTAVREEKAFCHHCGTPMNAAKAERETPLPDFGATVRVPPPRPAPQQPLPPPPVNEVQTTGRATAPVSSPATNFNLPAPQAAPLPPARRKSSRRIGVGFVILLLFLMFLAFVLAIVTD